MTVVLPASLMARGWQTVHGDVEGLVAGDGSLTPRFILVGEAPGETEVTAQKPFTGRAGVELDKSLAVLGVTRADIFITSAYHSRPFHQRTKIAKRTGAAYLKKDNRPPTQREIRQQAFLLDYELAQLPTDLILTIGNVGLRRLLGPTYRVGTVHGQLFTGPVQCYDAATQKYVPTKRIYRVMPTFHPAAVFYNRQLQLALTADLARFKQLL
ncbi:uracil-DNA glycosylase [Loigolactobacillus binensis]|uniref:Uracil-DNA glycosylase n=1 Tax=Loigolactobacillus binensis TaxID=2559922 RepID=A0ABW3ECY7_9LACO|nr:uracil-DNA glycosylase [Loigolactobacillus binensis]